MPGGRDELHILYELCVQRPAAVINLIRAAHASATFAGSAPPLVLHEDFSGTGAVSRAWVASDPLARAVATDLDQDSLAFGRSQVARDPFASPRITWLKADVRTLGSGLIGAGMPDAAPTTPADAIFVGNFSIGELHSRDDLIEYLRAARRRLTHSGVFICDTYGGAAAFRTGLVHRAHPGRESGERILYTWEQRSIDPFTARVTNALHFRVERGGEIVAEHFDAFIYHWRLWSVPELRDAMHESGFASSRIVGQLDAAAAPTAPPAPTDAAEHHIVCVAAYV